MPILNLPSINGGGGIELSDCELSIFNHSKIINEKYITETLIFDSNETYQTGDNDFNVLEGFSLQFYKHKIRIEIDDTYSYIFSNDNAEDNSNYKAAVCSLINMTNYNILSITDNKFNTFGSPAKYLSSLTPNLLIDTPSTISGSNYITYYIIPQMEIYFKNSLKIYSITNKTSQGYPTLGYHVLIKSYKKNNIRK